MTDFDELWNYNNPAETHAKFLKILDKTDITGNESYVGQLYTQLARTQSLQGNWDDARAYLKQAKSLLDRADKITGVRYLLELGRTYNSSGDKAQAYDLFSRAWELAKDIQADGYAVDAAHMLAIAVETPEDILDWNLQALDYAKNSSQPAAQKWLGSLYNNIGWAYFEDGKFDTALEMFGQALIEREKQNDGELIRVAKWCIARVQRELGDVQSALQTQLNLLSYHQQHNSADQYVYEELAHCYQLLSDADTASKYASLAHELLASDDWMQQQEPARLQALKDLI